MGGLGQSRNFACIIRPPESLNRVEKSKGPGLPPISATVTGWAHGKPGSKPTPGQHPSPANPEGIGLGGLSQLRRSA